MIINKSYPFGHDDGEMSPRVPKDNSFSDYSSDGWLRRHTAAIRSCKITKATWLAKAF